MIEIKRWDTGEVIFSGDYKSIKDALEDGISKGISFNYAKLNYAELNYAELNNAELNNAELNNAELNNAKLNDAVLNNAKLNDAELKYAKLNNAKLNDAELNNAKLNDAELNNAKLNGAELNGANSNRPTYYNVKSDIVECGCFRGTLKEFTKAVIKKYGSLEKTKYQFFINECEWAVKRLNNE